MFESIVKETKAALKVILVVIYGGRELPLKNRNYENFFT